MDGKVIIKTELSTKQLEKDITKAESELNKFSKEEERLLTKKQSLELNVDKAKDNLQTIDDKLRLIEKQIERFQDYNTAENLASNVDYQKALNQRDLLNRKAEEYLRNLDSTKDKITQIGSALEDNKLKQEEINTSISEMQNKLIELKIPEDLIPELNLYESNEEVQKLKEELNSLLIARKNLLDAKIYADVDSEKIELAEERIQNVLNKLEEITGKKWNIESLTNLEETEVQVGKVGKGLEKITKKVVKWGLAVFGVRTAYNAIRHAMSVLSQYDNQMTADIEYIRYALANTLQPIIQTLLKLVMKLLQYINYIAKAWTGKDLFKTADAFKNAQKNAKNLNKELKKTTASFDEINTVSSGGADETSGISIPSTDLTGIQGEVPAWLQWIVENKDTIIAVMGAIGVGIFTWKLGLEGIKALGIGVAVAGIILLLQDLKDLFDDPTWEKFGKVIRDIGLIIIGVGLLIGNVPLIVAGVIALIVGLVIQNWEKIKKAFKDGIQWIKDKFKSMVTFFSNLISKIVGLFKKIGTKVGNAISGAFKAVINGILKAIENILNFPIKQVNKLIDVINKVPGINISALPTFSLPRLAKGGIINQPGRGTPVGYSQAIGGERGAEGVLPLTDSQQMALLGEAIGKYIRIDNVIDVNMDSRRINRILQSSNNRVNFASNR